jgi:hypothetical protein
MINPKYKHSALTGKIINCAMEVHCELGNGFQVVIYQHALAHEFDLRRIPFKREYEMPGRKAAGPSGFCETESRAA